MNPHRRTAPKPARSFLCLALVLHLLAPGALPRPRNAPNAAPAALVKNIVVNNLEQTEVGGGRATVTRAGRDLAPVSAGLILYRGDVVETFADTKLTILFLDEPVAERGNEVIIDADSRVGISSTNSWWGTVWAKVKGTFESRTKYVRLGAKGTEYEFRVFKGEERSTLIVLEGAVEVRKGTFPLDEQARAAVRPPVPEGEAATPSLSTPASFTRALPAQEQYGRALDVGAGQATTFDFTFHIANNCGEQHRFAFQTSGGAEWLQVGVERNIVVPPRQTRPVSASVKIDATRLRPGQYRGRIFSTCVDCRREAPCNQAQLEWPINLTVNPSGETPTPRLTPTPTPTPTSTPTSPFLVRELEEATLTRGFDRPVRAAEDRVLSVLSWTNEVILNAQPTYPAQNLLPHFSTPEQRSQNFRSARQNAVLGSNPAGSNKILGDVYSDWGEGAQAVRAYEKELSVEDARRRAAPFMADLGEAYRLTGQLSRAEESLDEGLRLDRRAAPVLNGFGNLNLDRARIAADKGESGQAREHLRLAQESYQGAAPGMTAQPTTARGGRPGATVIQANLGETYLVGGSLAQREGNTREARGQFETSVRLLSPVQQSNPQYPFATTGLGRAYQGLGNVAQLEGNASEARAAYAKAESQHRQAIARHPDMAEAYFNLGDLYEDQGRPEEAKENYRRAIKARPEQPASYYPLAVLLQQENPRLAAALAGVYLKLLPEEFKQGEKARNARRTERGESVPAREPVGTGGGATVDPTPGGVAVPNVVGKTRGDADRAIREVGLTVGSVGQAGSPKSSDVVISQRPAAGAAASRGSAIDFVLGRHEAVKVPDVGDDKLETAKRKITERGLTVGQVTTRVSCESVGKVLAQNPRKDTKVDPGTVVDITVGSVGEDGVSLPDLSRQSRGAAEQAIRNMGLTLGRVGRMEVDDERVVPESVVRQKPAPGSALARGCQVELTLAVPVEYVDVGNYVNLTEGQAQRLLAQSGLHWYVRHRAVEGAAGRVLDQNPPPGSRVRKGSFVSLLVSAPGRSTPPPPDTTRYALVPNVVGMSAAGAEAAIRRAGLVPEKTLGAVRSRQVPPDRVYSQQPGPGERVPLGTAVRFVATPPAPPPVILR